MWKLLLGVAVAASGAYAEAPVYTPAATQSCLETLPHAVAGLPPATPPVPPTLFVSALQGRKVGVWYGSRSYRGVVLTFFESAGAARTALRTRALLHGGRLVRNVVVTSDGKPAPGVLGCLRSRGGHTATRPAPAATPATFAGGWGGHTRGLSITATGRGRERTDDGCCRRVYELTFRILSVRGTLTRAVAVYRVVSFRRYESGTPRLRAGDVGRLLLKNGIVTNTLTGDIFCSDPAWGATGACGA